MRTRPPLRSTRTLAAVGATAAVALTAAACGGGSTPSSSGSSSSSSSSSGGGSSAGFQAQHKGGTLKLVAHAAAGTLDPKINYTLQYWQLYQAMYDGLLAFKKVDGQNSFTVVPDLATAMPQVSDGGATYTFTLRKGIKFSNGKDVTVDDVAASFKRIFTTSSPTAGSFYNGLVGADGCIATPATCDLSKGVVVDPATNQVVLHLTAPDPELPYKLAVPHAAINPADAPAQDAGSTPIPTTGAYMADSYDPNRALKLVRNPYFKEWSHDAQPQGYPDEIDETFGNTVEANITAVENGQADWNYDPPPADRLNEIGTKYAKQAHVNALTAVWYLAMNVNLPPFNNLQARQAINWAVDRNAAVKIYGGTQLAQPACTFLPPGFPGHQDFCDYTSPSGSTWKGADLDKAKQLVQQSGTAGQEVGIVVSDDDVNKSIGEYLQSMLTSIGYKATLKPISGNIQFTYIQNTNNKVQISLTSWYQDYPAASDFLNVLLGCGSFHPGSDSSINIAGFCDKQTVEPMIQDALKSEATDGLDAANAKWTAVDKAVMQASPVAPVLTPKLIDFLSARVGNYEFSKQFYMLVDQLWVK